MTLVMARQWDDRIIMLSDTLISDRNAPHRDIIPGQLKAIMLSHNLSVAYAGWANRALHVIREVRTAVCQGSDLHLQDVLEHLCQATNRSNGDVDFLVASHYEEPVLFKIWNGQISRGAGSYWIGDPSAASAVQRAMDSQSIREIVQKAIDSQPIRELGKWYLEEEVPLRLAFADVVRESPFPGVGGFSFTLLGSPLGHCYIGDGGFFAWDSVKLSEIDTPDYRRFEKTGTTHYQYSLTAPQQPGAGVAGVFLPQVELAYVYSPLQSDSVLRRPGVTLEGLSSEVNQIASELICSSEFTAWPISHAPAAQPWV
jgi:hypothetical protein